MSDEWKSKFESLMGELSDHVKDMPTSTHASEHSDNDAELMDSGPDEGDPGTEDEHGAEGDDKEFDTGSTHERHVEAPMGDADDKDEGGSDAAMESSLAGGKGDDKEAKKAMLLSILKKHG